MVCRRAVVAVLGFRPSNIDCAMMMAAVVATDTKRYTATTTVAVLALVMAGTEGTDGRGCNEWWRWPAVTPWRF